MHKNEKVVDIWVESDIMVSGSKGRKAVHACMIRLLNL